MRRDAFDNVYAEARPTHYFPLRDCKLVSIKVQCNPLELLGVDELFVQDARARRDKKWEVEEEYVEENVGEEYT